MADITDNKAIFFVTSPRTPLKMIEEIRLLIDMLRGKEWNTKTQTTYAKQLAKSDFFEGKIRQSSKLKVQKLKVEDWKGGRAEGIEERRSGRTPEAGE